MELQFAVKREKLHAGIALITVRRRILKLALYGSTKNVSLLIKSNRNSWIGRPVKNEYRSQPKKTVSYLIDLSTKYPICEMTYIWKCTCSFTRKIERNRKSSIFQVVTIQRIKQLSKEEV